MDSYWQAAAAPENFKKLTVSALFIYLFLLSNGCGLKCSEVQYLKQNLLKVQLQILNPT